MLRSLSGRSFLMEHHKLLIIGAGASGIAAATRLLEKGFSNFRIIEAEDRFGGRINSTYLGNTPLELGAEWIHGEQGNSVYELASKFNLTDNTCPYFFNNTKFFEYSGNQIHKDISLAFARLFDDIISVEEKDVSSSVKSKMSIGEYFDREFEKGTQFLKGKFNISEKLCDKFRKVFELWENSIDGSHSWYDTSLSGHLEYWECSGNLITRWKNNCYATLFDLLTRKNMGPMQELPIDDKIYFNKEATKIRWNKSCDSTSVNVEVTCSDGSVFSADHVLFTCSLGVLKDRASNMFSPPLPPKKLSCIRNLGFGTVDKIFLKFSHPWWKDDFDGFAFLWSEEERRKDHSGWLSGVICFHPVDTTSAVLRGWITGEAARFMETLPNEEIIEGLNYLFDKFLGGKHSVPSIEACLPSKWFTNPHFRGSYSCRLMKSERANVWASDLAEPVCNVKGLPVLTFGGEATSNHFFSTVHGAVEAGWRESERLLPFLRGLRSTNGYQVVIVGAGISGLAAAKTLFERGITNVVVLEAQSKPGGRISSVSVDDYHLELGAQWIHGEKNEVFRLSKANDLLREEHSSEGEGLYLRENGDIIDERIIKDVDDVVKDILEECEDYASSTVFASGNGPHSIGHELTTKFNEYLNSCVEDSDSVKEMKRDLLDWHNRFQLIDNSCSDLDNLSAKAWGLFKFCGGHDYVNFKRGYESLIDTLVKAMPEGAILCNTAVEKIDWAEVSSEKEYLTRVAGVKIRCKNGLELTGRHVIVTCSLGYLKSNHNTMFSPPLPKYLSDAIEMLDFGVLNKIFLIYDKPWWESDVKGFQLVWSHENSSESDEYWGKYVTGFDVIMSSKPILLGWVGGEGAKMVEKLSEDQVGEQATAMLRKFYRESEIPMPKRVIRSTWWSNEYVRGGYSHIPTKCDEPMINGANLARPVYTTAGDGSCSEPTLLLAGESTHKSYYSTVHGAYETGENQARVILDHLHVEGRNLSKDFSNLTLSKSMKS